MKRRRQPQVTKADFQRFKNRMLQAQADERRQPTPADSPTVIYSDALLRTLVVVEHGGQLWLCPRRPGGWSARSKVTMTTEAQAQRVRPATDIDAATLGIK